LKGYIFDIKRFALHDGPGIRTTIFMVGCPLSCIWCHNPESLREIPSDENYSNDSNCDVEKRFKVTEHSTFTLFDEIKKDGIFYEESGGGVTFSGGEPLNQVDFLEGVAALCKYNDITVVMDTSGFASFDAIERIYEWTDIFNYDLKVIDDTLHKKFTGVSNQQIISNLLKLTEMGNKVRLRIPLIPDFTDTEKNLNELIEFIYKLNNVNGIDLLPYNILAESKYKRLNKESEIKNITVQSDDRLNEIKELFKPFDFEVKLRG
jgi:pyruvate formate lyase activating enzyme